MIGEANRSVDRAGGPETGRRPRAAGGSSWRPSARSATCIPTSPSPAELKRRGHRPVIATSGTGGPRSRPRGSASPRSGPSARSGADQRIHARPVPSDRAVRRWSSASSWAGLRETFEDLDGRRRGGRPDRRPPVDLPGPAGRGDRRASRGRRRCWRRSRCSRQHELPVLPAAAGAGAARLDSGRASTGCLIALTKRSGRPLVAALAPPPGRARPAGDARRADRRGPACAGARAGDVLRAARGPAARLAAERRRHRLLRSTTATRPRTPTPRRSTAFLDAGPPPIVFTLGSSAVWTAGRFFAESVEAAVATRPPGDPAGRPRGGQRPARRCPTASPPSGYAPYLDPLPPLRRDRPSGGGRHDRPGDAGRPADAGRALRLRPVRQRRPGRPAAGSPGVLPIGRYRGRRAAAALASAARRPDPSPAAPPRSAGSSARRTARRPPPTRSRRTSTGAAGIGMARKGLLDHG